MKTPRQHNALHHELLAAGANSQEAHDLAKLAVQLGKFDANMPKTSFWRRHMRLTLSATTGLIALATLIFVAQGSLPGAWLYPVKTSSERVAVIVDPQYQSTVMMRRASEVRKLVASHANNTTVLATLAAYQTEAKTYASQRSNYGVFEVCKHSLQQAEAQASGLQRQAISQALDTLRTV